MPCVPEDVILLKHPLAGLPKFQLHVITEAGLAWERRGLEGGPEPGAPDQAQQAMGRNRCRNGAPPGPHRSPCPPCLGSGVQGGQGPPYPDPELRLLVGEAEVQGVSDRPPEWEPTPGSGPSGPLGRHPI